MRYYKPSIFAFLLAFLFLALPALTVFLVVGALMSFGTIYGFLVYKLRKAQKQMNRDFDTNASSETTYYSSSQAQEPNFQNVTILMKKKGGIFKSNYDELRP